MRHATGLPTAAVSLRQELVTQVVLSILSDDLAPGQRLPSTRELARRFHLHPKTVSAAYRQLERERWVRFPPRQRRIRARGQTRCTALTCPHTRSNYCEPLSFGPRSETRYAQPLAERERLCLSTFRQGRILRRAEQLSHHLA